MGFDTNFPELSTLVNLFPGHVYVLDANNIYRGCNELQAKSFGFNNINDVIGKRNREMPVFAKHPNMAEMLDNNNLKIMKEQFSHYFNYATQEKKGGIKCF